MRPAVLRVVCSDGASEAQQALSQLAALTNPLLSGPLATDLVVLILEGDLGARFHLGNSQRWLPTVELKRIVGAV